ncbi:DivIVA domain-containing protein [Planotetraspora kaengkrachanensis]|uniref:DivIVA domain-containing protein n=1 Tax=Planotetraspora kaengkrachanensis TaxID=575193 RepID=A0A8J3Q0U4_9ACTN|nr:DivIVA domain-containing protein [Planotetraspora kaengkrachanensis]GIG84441.1 hypothetical protein Pka01_75680 [Planotetraspora kaengkrachanensis]
MNRFPRVIGVRLGYDPEQVDELISRIERTLGRGRLDGPPVTADEIRGAKFGVKLGGYNETAVDFALDAFIVAVEARTTAVADQLPGETPDPDSVLRAAEEQGEHARPDEAREHGEIGDAQVEESEGPKGEQTGEARFKESGQARVELEESGGARAEVDKSGSTQAAGSTDAQAEYGKQGEAGRRSSVDAAPGDVWEGEAARVEQKAFRPGRLGLGYREQDVDALLDRVVATLRGTTDQPVTAEQIRAATFTTVVFRSGYAIGEVDRFLADMADVLERRRTVLEENPA